ncbi:ATP-binding protein [Vibrio mimicus]
MKVWGNTVGKARALNELNELIDHSGSKNQLAEDLYLSLHSLNSIERYFRSLPDDLQLTNSVLHYDFIEGYLCGLEEDLTTEFKEVKGLNPTKTIQNLVDEYILAFLNSEGGSIFWGINDGGVVKSLKLTVELRDDINKAINLKINTIQPSIDPTQIKVIFHKVINTDNGYVLEVKVPKSNSLGLHFNTSGNTWVRLNGCKQKLQGVALQEYIIQRVQKNN